MYYIPTDNLTISATITTDFPPPLSGDYDFLTRKTYQAFGDWNGMRWINKYSGVETIQTLSGSTTFDILPASGLYTIAKINEDFDASEMYKSLRYTDRLLNAQNLFDNFIGQSVGDNNADATTLGKLIYERIANFPSNIADVDTCDVTALYALCDELNIPIDNYQFLFPANLKRIFNLVSIKHSKLWGDRNKFNRNFKNNFSQNTNYAKNIGPQIDVLTYTVSAGTNLVFNQLFDNEFKLITTMVLNAYVSGGATYTYPLSTYNQNWGWGLENGITGPEIVKYYNVYEYVPTYENSQEEGVIDWQNPLNNLVETASGIDVWLKDDGIVDTLLDYQIRKGLRMFI
jgi:RNAse (barnase) inhibitor barstar